MGRHTEGQPIELVLNPLQGRAQRGAQGALNTLKVESVYRLERTKEQLVVKLDDDSVNTSSRVDGKKRRLLPAL